MRMPPAQASAISWSTVDIAAAFPGSVSNNAADFSGSQSFSVMKAGPTVTGVRFYWKGGLGAKSIKASLWSAGVRLANVTISVNAAGVYVATFASAVAIDTTLAWRKLYVSIYTTDGSNYMLMTQGDLGTAGVLAPYASSWVNAVVGPFYRLGVGGVNSADSAPAENDPGSYYVCEPVIA